MFRNRVKILRLVGFDVYVDASWLILAALVTWSLATGYFPAAQKGFEASVYWAMGLAGAMGLFVSIVLHELSHSVVARGFGMKIRGITLFIFGGVAELQDEPPSAVAEFFVAIAGPLASFALAFLFSWLSGAGGEASAANPANLVAGYLGLINLVLAMFNLLPAFPLDGGRVFRAALWFFRGDMRSATLTAANFGNFFGLFFIVSGFAFIFMGNFVGGIWWALIGLMLRGAAQGAMQDQLAREHFEGEPVSRFMVLDLISVPPDISIQAFIDDYLYRHFHDVYPVVDNGRVLGLVAAKEVKAIARDVWGTTHIRDILHPLSPENSVHPDTDAMQALALMTRTGNYRLLVVDGERLIGLVTMKDLMRLFEMKIDLSR
ncbi:MAG: site-2 protease family protein [Alphaproteobacteria bacterium]|nr:MAG: site-2 protease family protein [Alphaproteobacteria bacterium]